MLITIILSYLNKLQGLYFISCKAKELRIKIRFCLGTFEGTLLELLLLVLFKLVKVVLDGLLKKFDGYSLKVLDLSFFTSSN
jgi:hypothetical protein